MNWKSIGKWFRELWYEINRKLIFVYITSLGFIVLTIVALLSKDEVFRYYYARFLLFIIILAVFLVLYSIYYAKKWYKEIVKHTCDSEKHHIAIIIPYYSCITKTLSYGLLQMDKFFKSLDAETIPYRVYLLKEVKEFQEVIDNKNIIGLIIFGHGTRHGLLIDKYICYYCDIKCHTHIKFIAQFHCNDQSGKSLAEYCNCKNEVSNKLRVAPEINSKLKNKEFIKELKGLFA